ncbi:DNA polymerase III subunit delta [Helicobacter brantae]|uniref:Uncharacterized protein n=1 Tax=Helicobacter brantae TaxID=375927 RepID=A0A3D8J259_9HELI|nr:DNA polymerase III subunit delta [Helicobacter brantae]RDU71473.1 hypothetical protein CQA58_02710 [Helicobacter brantae]
MQEFMWKWWIKMYKKDLDLYLQKSTPQASLLYGEENFWIGYYSKLIAQRITTPENIMTFYYGDYNYSQVFDLLNQSSLFGDSTLVVLKIDKKISKKELGNFLEAMKKNPNNSLIIEFYKSDSKSVGEYGRDFKEMAGAFKGEGVVEVRFFELKAMEAQTFLVQRAKELGINIHPRNLSRLLEMQNWDLSIALKELEKFTLYSKEIEEDDILRLCSDLGSFEVEDLIQALLRRKDVMKIYARLEEEGVDDMSLVSAISSHFYKLFLIFSYMRAYGKVEIKEALGYVLPNHIADSLTQEALAVREDQYRKIFEVCLRWRQTIMSGKAKILNPLIALGEFQEILR